MGLEKQYPYDFERIWKAWPKWPPGRSRKELAYRKWVQVKKEDGLDDMDVDALVMLIDRMTRDRKSWQKGDPYGPQGLQVWLHQRGWVDALEQGYENVRQPGEQRDWSGHHATDEENQRKYWQAAHAKGVEVPEKYRHYLEMH